VRDLIARSALFDAAWYVSQYPEIAEFGDPALHYALFGATERRNPGPHFNAVDYLERYQDVAEYAMNPLVHYLEYGAGEGRAISTVDGPVQTSQTSAEVPADEPRQDYETWVCCYDTLSEKDRAGIVAHIRRLRDRPLISIAMPVYNTNPIYLRNALDSILAQLYPDWELCIADDASTKPDVRKILIEYANRDKRIKVVFRTTNGHISAASNSALELATGSYIALMDHDDELSPHALYMVAVELDQHPEADIIYSDEDRIDDNGTRSDPHFKPEWNLELFHSYNVINHLGVYRAALVRSVGGFREGFEGSQDYDLALRILDNTREDRICHIPHILYHWRIIASTFSTTNLHDAVEAGRRALAEHFERRGESVTLIAGSKPYITRVIRPLAEPPPLVSLIVPTRDRFELLNTCIEGLLHKTNYPNIELLVVDNESREPATIAYLESLRCDSRVQILHVPGPFNFSALNNMAVGSAAGDVVGFINNDIEVIEPDWLKEMVSHVIQPGVGAVGAKLLYPDGRVQHAGVVVGLGGVAGHSHKYFPGSDFGYFCRLQLTYNVSCVTAACMLMPRKVFQEVHGFDDVNLTIAFNDVDLCLKIRKAGYSIVWTPYAELYHHESASRGSDETPENIERATQEKEHMKQRWGDILLQDPNYSPNLTLDYENYSIAFPPRAVKPWRAVTSITSSVAINAQS
jgi:GT2 family glycosyltransferase